jgi:hypothetical protein
MKECKVTVPNVDELFREDDCHPELVKKSKGEPKQDVGLIETLKDDVSDVVDNYVLSTRGLTVWEIMNLKNDLRETIQKWWTNQNTNS